MQRIVNCGNICVIAIKAIEPTLPYVVNITSSQVGRDAAAFPNRAITPFYPFYFYTEQASDCMTRQ
jgi:hypothetical protein